MSSTTTTWVIDTNTKSGSATTFTDTVSSLRLVGAEGEDAILRLFADEGDDNADQWRIVSQASTNKLNFMSFASGSWSNVLSVFGSSTAASQYLALPAASKLYLDGAGGTTYLQESSDGHLEINSGTVLDLTAPTIDINSSSELNIDTEVYDLNAGGALTIDASTVTIKGAGASKYGDDDATLDFNGSGAVSETGMTSFGITPSGAITLTAGAASTWSTSSGALTITSAAAATWSTAAGALSISGATEIDLASVIIDINATTTCTIDNTNTSNGVVINAATSGGPISIGHATSETTVNDNLTVTGTTALNDDVTIPHGKKIIFDSADTYIYANTDDPEDLVIGADADIILEPDGNVGIGTATPGQTLTIYQDTQASLSINSFHNTDSDGYASAILLKKAGGTAASSTTVANGEILGKIAVYGHDGTNIDTVGAQIDFRVNTAGAGALDTNDLPTDIHFQTAAGASADDLATKMVINADGKVGIGTASPLADLHIKRSVGWQNSASPALGIEVATGDPCISLFDSTGDDVWHMYHTTNVFKIASSAHATDDWGFTGITNQLSLDTSGNLTLLNNGDLSVLQSTSGAGPGIIIKNTYDDANNPQLYLINERANPANNDLIGQIVFQGDDNGNDETIYAQIQCEAPSVAAGSEIGSLHLYAFEGALRETLVIRGYHVGIGTSVPAHTLVVTSATPELAITKGVLNASGTSGESQIDAADDLGALIFSAYDTGPYDGELIGAKIVATAADNFDTDDPHQAPTDIEFYTQDNTTDDTLGTPRMIIQDDGKVGIGETAPGVELDVAGRVAIGNKTTITIDGAGAVAPTQSFHAVAGAGSAADDLDTIAGGVVGTILVLMAADGANTITIRNGNGNILNAGGASIALDNIEDTVMYIFDGSNWLQIAHSDNGDD